MIDGERHTRRFECRCHRIRRSPALFVCLTLLLGLLTSPALAETGAEPPDTGTDGIVWRDRLVDRQPDAGASTGRTPPTDPQSKPDGPTPATNTPSLGSMLVEMLVALAVVCLLAYAALRWGLGRLGGRGEADQGAIDIIARRAIGPDRTILVVRVGPKTLIVGETESGMTRLGELDAEEAAALSSSTDEVETAAPSFASLLSFGGEET
jgi:flagellar biogenesis protein FliO